MEDSIKYYKYLVLYRGDAEKDAEPILFFSDINALKEQNKDKMHLFDDDMTACLAAIKYCLHLPRTELDTIGLAVEEMDMLYDMAQNIIVMPDSVVPDIFELGGNVPTLIIYTDDVLQHIKDVAKACKCELGAVAVSDINNTLLVEHWNKLFEGRNCKNREAITDLDKHFLLTDGQLLFLPVLFVARQYGEADEVYEFIYRSSDAFDDCSKMILKYTIQHNSLMKIFRRMYGSNNVDDTTLVDCYKKCMEEEKRRGKINVVLTMPGVSNIQIHFGGVSNVLPNTEKEVINLLGVHRAIAENALLVELPCVQREAFDKLKELEEHCMSGTNNKHINKMLCDLGSIVEKMLTNSQLKAIRIAKRITVFSDFAIGLSVFNGTDTALHTYTPVSYRTLTPLTRAFEYEMPKHPICLLNKKCKIIFAECVIDDEKNKIVRGCSKALVSSLEEMCLNNSNMQLIYRETMSIDDLISFIAENADADILHISAHGYCNEKSNVAGLMIGNEFWMANKNDYMFPPVVILSACNVNPRGRGTVNVSEMFLRNGAQAVLGTFIPIFATRNMVLTNRIYTYIDEAQKGSRQYATLADLWTGVAATNAIHEIAESSERLFQWLWEKNDKGITRMEDFTQSRCVGKLHGPTIYSDTIEIVKEMLIDEGLGGKFDDILNQKNYLPESFFYQWIGFPQNIFLYEP